MTDNYFALSKVYDALNADLDYNAWAKYIDGKIKKHSDIDVSLVLANGVDTETARTKISEIITKYLQKNAFSGTYISYAQIGSCILSCDEIKDYRELNINGGTDNISIGETEVPVLGVVTVA